MSKMIITPDEVLENQKVLIWTHLRSFHKHKRSKLPMIVNGCKVERFTAAMTKLTFMDPITDKMVTIKRSANGYQILNNAPSNAYIPGFEGFVDRKKRPKRAAALKIKADTSLQAPMAVLNDSLKINTSYYTTQNSTLARLNDQPTLITAPSWQGFNASNLTITNKLTAVAEEERL